MHIIKRIHFRRPHPTDRCILRREARDTTHNTSHCLSLMSHESHEDTTRHTSHDIPPSSHLPECTTQSQNWLLYSQHTCGMGSPSRIGLVHRGQSTARAPVSTMHDPSSLLSLCAPLRSQLMWRLGQPQDGRSEILFFGRLTAAEGIPLPVGHRQQHTPRGAQLPPLERRRACGRARPEVRRPVHLHRHLEPALRDHRV